MLIYYEWKYKLTQYFGKQFGSSDYESWCVSNVVILVYFCEFILYMKCLHINMFIATLSISFKKKQQLFFYPGFVYPQLC